jgi:hypothetical protein
MGLFKNTCRPAKPDPAERVLSLSLPPPVPSRKTIHNLPKKTFHQDYLITNVRSQTQIPWTSPIYEWTVRTSQRIRVRDEESTVCFLRQEHTSWVSRPPVIVRNNDQSFPTPNTTRRVSGQWDRTLRSLVPVRLSTRPSTPLSLYWCDSSRGLPEGTIPKIY